MRKFLFVSIAASATLLTACTSHYQLTGVSRTRILIDKTYDAQPDAAASAFLAPYKHQVDSIMGPVVGEVAHDMAANRPESDLSNLLTDIFILTFLRGTRLMSPEPSSEPTSVPAQR